MYIISLSPPPPYPLPPFSPSLISLMVSVDVKHHVYLLNSSCDSLKYIVQIFADLFFAVSFVYLQKSESGKRDSTVGGACSTSSAVAFAEINHVRSIL